MNYTSAAPVLVSPGDVALPVGWMADWSAEYGRYYYVNARTNESTWICPNSGPQQPQPSPSPTPVVQQQYFQALQQQQQPQYNQSPVVPIQHLQQSQLGSPPAPQQQVQYSQYQPPSSQQSQQQCATLGGHQEQQRTYSPPAIAPNSNYAPSLRPNPPYAHPSQQNFTLPATPNTYNPQQYSMSTAPSYNQQPPYTSPTNASNTQLPPALRAPSPHYPTQVMTSFAPPPSQQQQYTGYPNQAQPQQPHTTSKTSESMMNKMSSKFTSLQKGLVTSTSAHPVAHCTTSAPASNTTDWKKWGKRAAIGIAGIGALTLGIDAASGLAGLDTVGAVGARDFSGDGDFTGGDATGVGDAQTAIDANAAQHAMEAQSQQNSSMLLDPVGTTYTFANPADASSAAVGYGLI